MRQFLLSWPLAYALYLAAEYFFPVSQGGKPSPLVILGGLAMMAIPAAVAALIIAMPLQIFLSRTENYATNMAYACGGFVILVGIFILIRENSGYHFLRFYPSIFLACWFAVGWLFLARSANG